MGIRSKTGIRYLNDYLYTLCTIYIFKKMLEDHYWDGIILRYNITIDKDVVMNSRNCSL